MSINQIKNHIVLASLVITLITTCVIFFFRVITSIGSAGGPFGSLLVLPLEMLLIYPIVLAGFNVFFIFADKSDPKHQQNGRLIERITLVTGVILTWMHLDKTQLRTDWETTLYEYQEHTPVFTEAQPTVLVLACMGVIGYLVLSFVKPNRMSPLIGIFSMAAMYIGMMLCSLWMIQWSTPYMLRDEIYSFLDAFAEFVFSCLFPLNCILIAVKVIGYKVKEWNEMEHQKKEYPNKLLQFLGDKLVNAKNWLVLGFVLMWPLLGLMIGILAFFGQSPDSIIKAWTETTDWTFSQM